MKPKNGRHLAFPFRIGPDGRAAQISTLEDHVRDEVMQLILTNPGERVFLPDFGTGVRRLVFENVDDTTAGLTKAMITRALSRWLGDRVVLEDLSVVVEDSSLSVDLKYRVAGTTDSRIMRFQRNGGGL